MSRLVFFIWFLSGVINISFSAYAQKTDSLETLLKTAKPDTQKVLLYYQLAWNNLASQPEKTKKYALEGLKLAQKLQYSRGEILLLNRLGDYYSHQAQYKQAIQYTTQSLQLAEKVKDKNGIADAYVMLSIIYFNGLHQNQPAIEYNEKAIQLYTLTQNKVGLASTYNLQARLFALSKDQLAIAHQYAQRAINIAKEVKNEDFLGWCLNSKALIFDAEGKLDSALHYLQISTQAYEKAGDQLNIAVNGILSGNIYLKQKKYLEALSTYEKNEIILKGLNARALLRDNYGGKAEAYSALQKFDLAYKYQRFSVQLKDSILNAETAQKISIIQSNYEADKQKDRIKLLEKEKQIAQETSRNYVIVSIILISSLLIILSVILWNNAQRKKVNRLLQEKNEAIALQNEELQQSQEEVMAQRDLVIAKNEELEALNNTKDKLFSIIGHDLRSPINSLKSLLELTTSEGLSAEEFKKISQKLKKNVENIHFTLDNLLHWAWSQMQGIQSEAQEFDLKAVVIEIINLLGEMAKGKKIEIKNLIPDNTFAFADIDHINLVIRNLMSNAIKFTPTEGQISVLTPKAENGFLEIWVQDTGIGMSQMQIDKLFNQATHFTTYGTANEKGTGLGLLLCREMIEKNGGSLWVESTPGEGTTFKFTLPIS
jgi:signal transduction histidine kinase